MLRSFEVVESKDSLLEMSEDEALLLSTMGRELASRRAWWGQGKPSEERSVIDIRRNNANLYQVTFREVIGVIQVGKVRIRVVPKIPWDHFVYIASHSEFATRLSANVANVEVGFEFLDMLSRWFVESTERLVRLGLRQDYDEMTAERDEICGQLVPIPTAVAVLKGQAVATCIFDELSINTPLNRVIRAASERVSCFSGISDATKKRARRLAHRMDGVGPFLSTDAKHKPDRLSKSYLHPISLARLILNSSGISLSDGKISGTSFLLRTPEIIEDGIRSIITAGIPDIEVRKQRRMLGDSGISMNPDVVFGEGLAVADVKYKYFGREWNRSDLNQIVAFATAFDVPRCAMFGFLNDSSAITPRTVRVGRVDVTKMLWSVGHQTSPGTAAQTLIESLLHWLKAPIKN